MQSINERIAQELAVPHRQVDAAVELLDGGATVPFVARYRKEATGGLDDAQLRTLEDRLGYLRELEARRETILRSVADQGKLTSELERDIRDADTKTRLEDLYLPYKPKRRTKAQIAREAGLEPLAFGLFDDPSQDPEALALNFVDPDRGVEDTKAALDGARQILMERFAEDAELLGHLRGFLWENGELQSRLVPGKEQEGAKFGDYFEFAEKVKDIPSHRALAMFRGRNEGVLTLELATGSELGEVEPGEAMVAEHFGVANRGRPADAWLRETVRWAWKVKILTHLELELKTQLKEQAEEEAIRVFAHNLKDLLLAAPAGHKAIIGLDPGLRTGVKVAVVDATGKLVDTATIYPHPPKKEWDRSIAVLAALAIKHGAKLVSIGNGTASRETDRLAADLAKRHPELGLQKLVVNEAGASVYSASELASQELPSVDVSLRGAASIARRLQDPLAELVKIDPKSIGVGQYQHDVNQSRLARMLDNVVEDCVNAVGVDVNTASVALLSRVSGLSRGLAENLVGHRDQHGAFADRESLKKVPRLGAKTFEQAAGFLRIGDGRNPLDASAVHPEAYPVVERLLAMLNRGIKDVIGNTAVLRQVDARQLTDERFGLPTVRDILAELEKPGRDPRPEFKTARFQEGIEKLEDLQPGMVLEGVVSNVANFGAFVDVGVHQDGLVHISALADRFVKDPREVVRAGDVVKVKVIEVDIPRRRVALSMRLGEPLEGRGGARRSGGDGRAGPPPAQAKRPQPARPETRQSPAGGALASALADALKSKR